MKGKRHSATVTQTGSKGPAPAVTTLPEALAPLAMFRCHEHLLVVAARRAARQPAAMIVPIPIIRGPFAAASAARAILTTGCQ